MRRRGRPTEPPRGPTLPDLLPMWCEECGFKAETEEEFADHEHGEGYFQRYPPGHEPEEKCTLCNPRAKEHEKRRPTFCSNHDEDDLKAKREAMRDYMERRMKEGHEQSR